MATPRSRWIRVSDLVLDEDWDDATLATVVRLLAWMRQRWARENLPSEQAIEACISGADAMRITGQRRPHTALERLSRLPLEAGLTSASARLERIKSGSRVVLRWPKVAEYQGWIAREQDAESPRISPSGDPAHGARRTKEKIKNQSPRKPRSARPAVVEEDPLAIGFASDFRSALERVHPGWKPPGEAAFVGWVREARLLLAERPEGEPRALARWLFDTTSGSEAASFWRGVVLGVPKFRVKFDQIAARKRQEGEHGANRVRANGHSTSDLAERARAYLRAAASDGAR